MNVYIGITTIFIITIFYVNITNTPYLMNNIINAL